ncbi:hypothetical protein DNU06_07920 [Putridiphycobacter roseus]|uniref:Uncharacterized protein n=1 Tax=Putridiphycobacter roseus TaxID=2219161 RepID=A0A2W1N2I6_9FLAO|nr:hypothetical protein [Putridiphycobacter roseus]PZE17191.1 hypothetical protein DNU06_07920 [Putridiphycobacter roseus]
MEENTSFKKLDTEFRKVAKSVQNNKLEGLDVYNYVMKKSFLSGPSEIITVSHKNDKIQMIGIKSKDPKEYLQIAGILRNASPMIKLVENRGSSEIYTTFEEDFTFQIGQDLYQKGDNVLTIIRND